MSLWYVKVEQIACWNISVEAENEEEAQEKAIDELAFCKEDYILAPEITLCEKVKDDDDDWD